MDKWGRTLGSCLPEGLRQKLLGGSEGRKVLGNLFWLALDKAFRLGVGLMVSVWLARYLGPDQLGMLNYAMALVALCGVFAGAGVNSIVVRDLVRIPERASVTLGSAFALQGLGGLLAAVLAVLAVFGLRHGDPLVILAVSVMSMTLLFKAAETVKYWFEAQVESRFTVWVENGVFALMALARVILILRRAPLMAFLWLSVLEVALTSVGLFAVYRWRGQQIQQWQVRLACCKQLLQDGWPLMLSGVASMAYMRLDQIMLGELAGNHDVGVFAAAIRISEIWYMVPMIIMSSTLPVLVKVKENEPHLYLPRLKRLCQLLVFLSLAVAIPMTFLSTGLVTGLFGSDFVQAGPVLAVHIWTGMFVSIGVISSTWYLTENLQKLALARTLAGLAVNVAANYWLIPGHGVVGAAVATVLAQFVAAYLFDAFDRRTRPMFWMKTRAILTFYSFGSK